MDFIMVPAIVGIVVLGIYKLFELFARRKERLAIIEKIGEKFDPSMVENKFNFPARANGPSPFGTLKIACLLLGVGLGLLVGFFICQVALVGEEDLHYGGLYDVAGLVYGASTLFFGGLGLLIAFIAEMKMIKKDKE